MSSDYLKHFRKGYSTHTALLLKVLDHSEGDVIELGGGLFSTPWLHWYCKNKGRKLTTYDDDIDYYNFEKQFQSKGHKIRFVKDWDDVKIEKVGVVFIDHGGKRFGGGYRRGKDAIRFKDSDYIVMHDTDEKYQKDYGYDEVWKHFKNRFDYKECQPETSVVSNKDLSWI